MWHSSYYSFSSNFFFSGFSSPSSQKKTFHFFFSKYNMCGISALILADSNGVACPDLFESLGLLQHRGQVKKETQQRR